MMRDGNGALVQVGDRVLVRVYFADDGGPIARIPGFTYLGPGSQVGLVEVEIIGERLEVPSDAVFKA